MVDSPEPGPRNAGRQTVKLEDLDLAKMGRVFRWAPWVLGLVLLWMALRSAHSFYTDWLWFSGVGHEGVLLTTAVTQVVLYAGAFVLFLALAAPNLYYAWRATRSAPVLPEGMSSTDYAFVRKMLVRSAAGVTLLAAFILAGHPAAEWETALAYLNQVPFGETDPIFGLRMPRHRNGVPPEILNPCNTRADKAAYDAEAIKLRNMFRQNFESKGFDRLGIEQAM
jgi:hypothetical protein